MPPAPPAGVAPQSSGTQVAGPVDTTIDLRFRNAIPLDREQLDRRYDPPPETDLDNQFDPRVIGNENRVTSDGLIEYDDFEPILIGPTDFQPRGFRVDDSRDRGELTLEEIERNLAIINNTTLSDDERRRATQRLVAGIGASGLAGAVGTAGLLANSAVVANVILHIATYLGISFGAATGLVGGSVGAVGLGGGGAVGYYGLETLDNALNDSSDAERRNVFRNASDPEVRRRFRLQQNDPLLGGDVCTAHGILSGTCEDIPEIPGI